MVDHRLKLATVVARGERKATLESLAVKLAARIDDPKETSVSALAAQLRAVLSELEELTAPEKSKSDELSVKRADRRKRAAVQQPAAGGKQRRSGGGRAGGVSGSGSGPVAGGRADRGAGREA